jgi:hypothetical protein
MSSIITSTSATPRNRTTSTGPILLSSSNNTNSNLINLNNNNNNNSTNLLPPITSIANLNNTTLNHLNNNTGNGNNNSNNNNNMNTNQNSSPNNNPAITLINSAGGASSTSTTTAATGSFSRFSILTSKLRAQIWARKRTRLALFFIAYILFLSPVLVALIREFTGLSEERKRLNLLIPIMHTGYGPSGGPRFLVALAEYLSFQVAMYFALRIVGRRFHIKIHDKTFAKHKDDMLRLCYFAMTMALVAGIATRIDEGVVNTETQLKFLPLVLAYTIAYTIVFEICRDFDITLGPGLCSNKIGIIVVITGFFTVVAVLVSLFLTAWNVGPEFFAMYAGTSAVGFIAHCILFLVPWVPFANGVAWTHLHHWYWPVPLSHLCVFHTDVSNLAQAIFLAIHLHGVSCFGVDPLFYDTERRARHPSDFDWQIREKPHENRSSYDPAVTPPEKGSNPNLAGISKNDTDLLSTGDLLVDETMRLLTGSSSSSNDVKIMGNNNGSVDDQA